MRERGHLEDPSVYERLPLRCIFRKWDVGECTRTSWLRVWTGGGHL
jgi:hypothetical protein